MQICIKFKLSLCLRMKILCTKIWLIFHDAKLSLQTLIRGASGKPVTGILNRLGVRAVQVVLSVENRFKNYTYNHFLSFLNKYIEIKLFFKPFYLIYLQTFKKLSKRKP